MLLTLGVVGIHGVAAAQTAPTLDIDPVFDEDTNQICFNVSWMNPTGGQDFPFTSLSRWVAGVGTTDVLGRPGAFGYEGERLGVPYTSPTRLDCPPSGADVYYTVYSYVRDFIRAREIVRVPVSPQAPGMVAYTPPATAGQAGVLTWGELAEGAPSGHATITGYEVQYRIDNRTHWDDVDPASSGTDRRYEDANVWKQGTTLHFRVRATNIVTTHLPHLPGGWGYTSERRTGTAPTVSGLTVTPSSLTDGAATFFPASNLQLAWTVAPSGATGQLIYRRRLHDMHARLELVASDLVANVATYQIPVPTDSGYEYAVQAYNLSGGGPLSWATFEIVPPQPDVPAPPAANVDLRGIASGNVRVEGPAELVAGRVHDFTVVAAIAVGSTATYRYGGERRGIAFDVGPGQRARWVAADNRAACVDVVLCLFQPLSSEHGYHPSDGTASRWLIVWKGSDSTDGFAAGDGVQVYVPPTVSAAATVTYGFAQLLPGTSDPVWIEHQDPSAGLEYAPRRSLSIRPLLPSATSFTARVEGTDQVRLEWVPATAGGTLQQVHRKLSSANDSGWARICCNLSAAQSWIVDQPPAAAAGSTASYDYRIGTFVAGGQVQWLGSTITVVLTGSQVGAPTVDSLPRFMPADQDATYSFADGASVDQVLPSVTGGDGTITYTVSNLSALNLRLETPSGMPRLRSDSASAGVLRGTLRAVDGDGDVDFLSFQVTVGEVLGPPRDLAANAAGQQITLTWNPPQDAGNYAVQGYRVERSMTGGDGTWSTLAPRTETADTRFEDRNLSGAQTWRYRVAAVDANGVGQFAMAQATTAPITSPGAPTGLSVVSGLQHVDLTWDVPAASGGAEVSTYLVEYSWDGASDTWQSVGDEPTGTTYTHSNLWPNWGAHYRVRARNAAGLGTESESVFVVTGSGGTAPTNLRATAGIRQISLAWTAPPRSGPDVRYRIEQSASGDSGSWNVLAVGQGTATVYAHVGLAPAQTVHYRVATLHRGGVSAPSTSAHATALAGVRVPFAPTGLRSVAHHGRIELLWRAPESDGGGQILGYRIESSDTGESDDWDDLEMDTGDDATSYDHMSLSAEQRIFHRVAAINSAGASEWSAMLESVVLGEQPAAPLIDSRGGQTINRLLDGDIRQVRLAFTAAGSSPGGPIIDYLLQMGYTPIANVAPEQFETVLVVRNLWNLGQYVTLYTFVIDPPVSRRQAQSVHFRMVARNGSGAGPPSNSVHVPYSQGHEAVERPFPERPSAPQNLAAEASPGRLGLSWDPPTEDGGAKIEGYRIEQWNEVLERWGDAVANTGSPVPAHLFEGIAAGAVTRYRVSAINSAGTSDPSPLVRTNTASTAVPAPPGGLTATAGSNAITLAWQAPMYDGGARITGYRVEHSASGVQGTWQPLPGEPAVATSRTHEVLRTGQRVYYRVFALNSAGVSQPTSTVVGQALANRAGPPSSLTATAGQSRVFLDWLPPVELGGGTIEGYRIERRNSGTSSWATVVWHSGTERTRHTDVGRAAGVALDYRVAAITGAGGSMEAEVSATPGSDRPEPPVNVVVTLGATGIDVDWGPPATAGTGAMINGYRIERSVDGEATWVVAIDDTQSTDTVFMDTAANVEDRPIYRVSAINDQNQMSIPAGFAQATGARLPPTPIDVQATGGWNQSTITWLPVPDSHNPAPTGYRIVVADSAVAAEWQVLADVDAMASSYIHTGIEFGQTTHYRVATRSAVGNSLFSAPQSALILDPETTLDVNGVDGFDHTDVLILYFALSFPELVGGARGETGFQSFRQAMLSDLVGRSTYVDSVAIDLLANARQLVQRHAESPADLNEDLIVDADDVLILYYASQMGRLLGDGSGGGTPEYRRSFLSRLATEPNPTDVELRRLLQRANSLLGN